MLAATAAAFVVGFCAPNSWLLEMFTHARIIYLVLFVVSIVLLILGGQRRLAVISALLLVFASTDVVSYWFGKQPSSKTTATVNILQMNLWGKENHEFKETLAVPWSVNADVIALSEVTNMWWNKFVSAYPDYPYQIVEPRYGGIGLLSRLPLKAAQVRYFGARHRPRIVADLEARDGSVFRLICVHTVTPFYLPPMRDGELKVVAAEARESRYPAVVAGDINCGPWSPVFTRFLSDSGLVDSERGFGVVPTWGFPRLPFSLLPLDHLFVSKDISVLNRIVGPRFGSDHRPVTVEVGLVNPGRFQRSSGIN